MTDYGSSDFDDSDLDSSASDDSADREIERLSDEVVRLTAERDAIIALCTKHYYVESRPVWWDIVGITGCTSPVNAVRVAAGLEKVEAEA